MSEIGLRRKLLEHTNAMVKSNNAGKSLSEFANIIDILGSLLSEWTGESVRVRIAAEGQPDMLDLTKRGLAADAAQARVAELVAWQEKVQMELVWPLQEKVAELERDAERYRFLREEDDDPCTLRSLFDVKTSEDLDAAIDAAREEFRKSSEKAPNSETAPSGK